MEGTKTIDQLKGYTFWIPAYQRGYRWEERQVTELLDDIWEFYQKKGKIETFYCLQPLVIKKHSLDAEWEVVDGQQRLTTIFIILQYLNDPKFDIKFETRSDSQEFLKDIKSKESEKDTNIDFHYIFSAFKIIEKWFEDTSAKDGSVKYYFPGTLLAQTRVIWYELQSGEASIEYFVRLNSSKIPLTNAELIKALLLQASNGLPRREEIAREWDQIEQDLQDKDFWCFLTGESSSSMSKYATKIDLLFELNMPKPKDSKDTLYLFHHYNKCFYDGNHKRITDLICSTTKVIKNIAESIWEQLHSTYLTLKEWKNDKLLYHYIGYLIITKKSTIRELLERKPQSGYDEFITFLKKKSVEKLNIQDNDRKLLQYKKHKTEITNILLLLNIYECIKEGSLLNFPFNAYLAKSWSLEHIHAQNSQTTPKQKKEWLQDILDLNLKTITLNETQEKDLKKGRESLQDGDASVESNNDREFFDEYIQQFIEQKEIESKKFEGIQEIISTVFGSTTDDIYNLALLTKSDNSKLSNNIFPIKRKYIIDMEKEGQFIPPATRNIFLKYYSEQHDNLYYWGEKDRDDYLEVLKKMIKWYKGESNG